MRPIVLVGMMGAGKTTVGQDLARRLGRTFVDSDRQVEARTGRTVAEIWASDGEPAFRRLEAEALAAALGEARGRGVVVAAAGGVVLDPANRRLLEDEAQVVWLRARPETLVERIGDAPGHRPLLAGDRRATLVRIDAERRPLYEQVAGMVVDVDGRDAGEVVDEVVRWLGEEAAPAGGPPAGAGEGAR